MKNFHIFIYFTFLLTIILASSASAFVPEVELSLGWVQGEYTTTRLGKTIATFRGIRYAEPPINNLRFQPAVPVRPWRVPFDASEEGPACPQPNLDPYLKFQSEDCLRLNVYTELSSKKSLIKKPVIVFFHPGGYYSWSGQSILEGPGYLLDQNIVLVTINYRLGALGFLSTGDGLAPGNLGLKDQVVALRWVQKHISKFGGDPNSVTIAGASAGSISISLHLVSPMSKGLFHRAILMSGSAMGKTPLAPAKKFAIKQAAVFGCSTDSSQDILNCLQNKTARQIVDSTPGFYEFNQAPISVYFAVVEPDIPGIERFLTGQPADLLRAGKFHNVPVIAGVTKDEFGGVVLKILSNKSLLNDLNEHWPQRAPQYFIYEDNTPRSLKISEELKEYFLYDQPISQNNWRGLSEIYADALIGFSVHRFVNLLAAHPSARVWYYRFTYQGQFSTLKSPSGQTFIEHLDDLRYLFYQPQLPPKHYIGTFDRDSRIVTTMTSMWANFAKTGRPIPPSVRGVTWKNFTPKNKVYLDIGDQLIMKTGLNEVRMEEWEKLFPL